MVLAKMRIQQCHLWCMISIFPLLINFPIFTVVAAPVGVCYGRVAMNLPNPSDAVNLIKSNGIPMIRLFNAEPKALRPFSGTGIQLMIGVPNEALPTLANNNPTTSLDWLQSNIFAFLDPSQIKYLAVGNEILLQDPFYSPFLVPAIYNLHQALQTLGLANNIKLSSPHAASVLSNSYPPSAGTFDPNLLPVILPLLQFLRDNGSPLMINVYPYFSFVNVDIAQHVSLDYALFRTPFTQMDQNLAYDNMFDATIDAFVYAMEKEGFRDIPIVVSETGWPTAGGNAASVENALAYNGNVARRSLNNVGTPKRPGVGIEVFFFDLFDENDKGGNEFERHFGIFGLNGSKSYDLMFN